MLMMKLELWGNSLVDRSLLCRASFAATRFMVVGVEVEGGDPPRAREFVTLLTRLWSGESIRNSIERWFALWYCFSNEVKYPWLLRSFPSKGKKQPQYYRIVDITMDIDDNRTERKKVR